MQTYLDFIPVTWNAVGQDLAVRNTPAGNTAVENVKAAGMMSSEELVSKLRDRQQKAAQMLNRLTPRERQVMQLVTTGLPNKTVAMQLNLSIKTVEKHRGSIMRKLQLRSICDLLQFWFTLTWDKAVETSECRTADSQWR